MTPFREKLLKTFDDFTVSSTLPSPSAETGSLGKQKVTKEEKLTETKNEAEPQFVTFELNFFTWS